MEKFMDAGAAVGVIEKKKFITYQKGQSLLTGKN